MSCRFFGGVIITNPLVPRAYYFDRIIMGGGDLPLDVRADISREDSMGVWSYLPQRRPV